MITFWLWWLYNMVMWHTKLLSFPNHCRIIFILDQFHRMMHAYARFCFSFIMYMYKLINRNSQVEYPYLKRQSTGVITLCKTVLLFDIFLPSFVWYRCSLTRRKVFQPVFLYNECKVIIDMIVLSDTFELTKWIVIYITNICY